MLLLGEKDFATGGHARFDASSLVMVTPRQSTSLTSRHIILRFMKRLQAEIEVDFSAAGSPVRLKPRLRSVFSAPGSGFGDGSFRKWTRGKSAPSLDVLRLLSERFHRSVDW